MNLETNEIVEKSKKILNRSKDLFKMPLPNAEKIDLRNQIQAEKDFIKEKENK